MGGTIAEKILGGPAGSIVEPTIDLLMGHDGTASLIIDTFRQRGCRVYCRGSGFLTPPGVGVA